MHCTNWKALAIAFAVLATASTSLARYWYVEYNRPLCCPHCGQPIQGMISRVSP